MKCNRKDALPKIFTIAMERVSVRKMFPTSFCVNVSADFSASANAMAPRMPEKNIKNWYTG